MHTKVEEKIFYPAMKAEGDEDGADEVLEALGAEKTLGKKKLEELGARIERRKGELGAAR